MKEMRVLGSTVHKLADEQKISSDELSSVISCTPRQIEQFYNGRLFLSFDQLSRLADRLSVSVDYLLDGDEAYYRDNVVHCMGAFSNEDAREEILDMIDDYLDLCDCAEVYPPEEQGVRQSGNFQTGKNAGRTDSIYSGLYNGKTTGISQRFCQSTSAGRYSRTAVIFLYGYPLQL